MTMKFGYASIASIVALVAIGSLQNARACSCGERPTICTPIRTSVVFVGRVQTRVRDTVDALNEMVFDFEVERAIAGVSERRVRVLTGDGGGDCGYPFEPGRRYVVYASREGDQIVTTTCYGNKPLEV